VTTSRRRESNRSTITPATRPNARNGRNRQKASAPTASAEPDISMTSQARAMFCIQVPTSETTWPPKNRR
jgi:hypothetical protein